MTGLSRREQRLLLDMFAPGWIIAWMLLDDAGIEHLRASWHGGHLRSVRSDVADRGTFFQVGKRGISVGRIEPQPVGFTTSEVITWASIRSHRATIPAPVREEIRTAHAAANEHNRSYPTFRQPEDRAAFADAHIAHHRDVVEPWSAEMARRYAAVARAVLAAFPAATGEDEPTDLLGFLAQLEAGVPA